MFAIGIRMKTISMTPGLVRSTAMFFVGLRFTPWIVWKKGSKEDLENNDLPGNSFSFSQIFFPSKEKVCGLISWKCQHS